MARDNSRSVGKYTPEFASFASAAVRLGFSETTCDLAICEPDARQSVINTLPITNAVRFPARFVTRTFPSQGGAPWEAAPAETLAPWYSNYLLNPLSGKAGR
jgi:hypothetical protein